MENSPGSNRATSLTIGLSALGIVASILLGVWPMIHQMNESITSLDHRLSDKIELSNNRLVDKIDQLAGHIQIIGDRMQTLHEDNTDNATQLRDIEIKLGIHRDGIGQQFGSGAKGR